MLALAVLGPWIGWIFGWWRGVGLYLASGVLGNLIAQLLPQLLPRGSESDGGMPGPSVGASTAILGLLGALLAVTYRRPERIPLAARARFRWAIPLTFLLTLGLGLVIRPLDNGAHLGGFVAGLALAWWLPPRKA
jgi:rhomboid protease GluP